MNSTFSATQVNDISVEGVPHSIAVDALQKAGNILRLVSPKIIPSVP